MDYSQFNEAVAIAKSAVSSFKQLVDGIVPPKETPLGGVPRPAKPLTIRLEVEHTLSREDRALLARIASNTTPNWKYDTQNKDI